MPSVSPDYIRDLYREMGRGVGWENFKETLRDHKGKPGGFDDAMLDRLITQADRFQDSEVAFPVEPERMADLMNDVISQGMDPK